MSNNSILTNVGAQVALANLGIVNTQLGSVQKKISTGQQVADATDNAAVFAVAQGIRANLQGYNSVNTGLNDAQGLVQTALAAATAISNVLPTLTATLAQLADGSLSDVQRQTYTANVKGQVDEILNFITGANYDGANLLGYAPVVGGSQPPQNVSVPSNINGSQLTVHAVNLIGQDEFSNGNISGGFYGLARLAYSPGAHDNFIDPVLGHVAYNVYGPGNASLSEIGSKDALAAFLDITATVNQFQIYSGVLVTAGSYFSGELAYFSQLVNSALASLGSDSNNIQLQLTFNQSIANSLTTGLGNLVDADLAQASAQLTALQTQQQLAVQTLSIANAQPQAILSLFK